jgi:hypothetical protein
MLPLLFVIGKYVTETNYAAEKEVVFISTHGAQVLDLHLDQESVIESEEGGIIVEKIATKE